MVISIGVFLVDKHKRILIGHPTYSSDGAGFWSIPKGKREGDETYHTTMAREFLEETGLQITNYPGYEIFLGAETYVHKKKSIVAFAHFIDTEVTDMPKCISFIEDKDGNTIPEMDRYLWATFDEALELLHYAQANILRRNRFIFEHEFAHLIKIPGQSI